jgi:hypothetical protein
MTSVVMAFATGRWRLLDNDGVSGEAECVGV